MLKAKDIMTTEIATIDPEDSIETVMQQMIDRRISGLPVVDMSGQLVGVITEYDLLQLIGEPKTGKNKVYHYMSREPVTVEEDESILQIADIFQKQSLRRLIVTRGHEVAGVISRRDILREIMRVRKANHQRKEVNVV